MMTELGVTRVIESKPRLNLTNTFPFVRTLLSVVVLCAVAAPVYALEALTDAGMSDATGEGLAFYADNFQFQMPSVAGDVSQSTSAYGNNYGAGTTTFGAGAAAITPGNYGSYVYLSPLGAVPSVYGLLNGVVVAVGTAGSTRVTPNRADLYLYGLSLSENNITAVTTAAGTLCTGTVFNGSGQVTTAGAGCVASGSVVAPANGLTGTLAHNKLFNSTVGTGAGGGGIKWGDATSPFTLSVYTTNTASVPLSPVTGVADSAYQNLPGLGGGTPQVPFLQFSAPSSALPATDSSNNLRLGMWMNLLQQDMTSLATQQSGGNNSLNPSGTAGPALQIQAIWDGFGINGSTINAFPTDPCPACVANPGAASNGDRAYANALGLAGVLRFNSQSTGVLRLSVGGSGTTANDYGVFNPYEGVYLQQLNVNLPLGNVNYQPLIFSSGVTNFGTTGVSPTLSLELARIPNIPSVYSKFYINYDCPLGTTSVTCTTNTGVTYNANGTVNSTTASVTGLTPEAGMCSSGLGSTTACPTTATHGNISIGNVYVNQTNSALFTYMYQATSGGPLVPGIGAACPTNNTTCNRVYPGAADASYAIVNGALARAATNNVSGVAFKSPTATGGFADNGSGATINLGNAAISGLAINHMKMTLTGL